MEDDAVADVDADADADADAVAAELVEVEMLKFLEETKETTGATCLALPLRAALVTADSDALSEFICANKVRACGDNGVDEAERKRRWSTWVLIV